MNIRTATQVRIRKSGNKKDSVISWVYPEAELMRSLGRIDRIDGAGLLFRIKGGGLLLEGLSESCIFDSTR